MQLNLVWLPKSGLESELKMGAKVGVERQWPNWAPRINHLLLDFPRARTKS